MKNKRSVVFFLFLFVMCVFLCNSQELEAKNNTKKSVQVTKKERCITVGDSYKIKLKKAKGYTFTSSDKTIATVSKKGTIKAKNKGKCTITASNNKNKYVYKITTERRIGGYIAVLSGIVTNIEVLSDNTERYTIELDLGAGLGSIHGENVLQKKYYVADLEAGRGVKVGEYTTLFTNHNKETCEGTLINEDTVFLTGVH